MVTCGIKSFSLPSQIHEDTKTLLYMINQFKIPKAKKYNKNIVLQYLQSVSAGKLPPSIAANGMVEMLPSSYVTQEAVA